LKIVSKGKQKYTRYLYLILSVRMKQFDWQRNVTGLAVFFYPASYETQQPALVSAPKPRSETDFKLNCQKM
jgi:hypothetical protein